MKPRVLLIIKGIDIGGNSGGSEHFGVRLARALRKMGVEVALCAYYRFNTPVEKEWIERLAKEEIPCFHAVPSTGLNFWQGICTIRRFVREKHIPLIHSHFQVGTLAGIGVKLLTPGLRLLRTAHTPKEFGTNLPGFISRLLFVQLLYPLALDSEAGVSPYLVRILDRRPVARLLGRKAVCVYNAIEDPVMSDTLQRPAVEPFVSGDKTARWILTSIGILNPLKRFDNVILAMPTIVKSIPEAHYAVVGSGPDLARLQALAQDLGVADRVWFLGQRSDVPAILRYSNVFVHPSQLEAMSTVILEAMQNAVPIVASDIPANVDLIEDNVEGLLFPVGDVGALAEKIIQVYQYPAQAESFARRAVKKCSRYNLTASAEQYISLYQALSHRMD